jgi:hypothetical protein
MSLIDPVDDVAGMFTKNDVAEAAGVLRAITVRLPVDRLCMIEAMASYAETSRSVMVNQLLKAGISAVLGVLPSQVREDIVSDAAERFEGEQ